MVDTKKILNITTFLQQCKQFAQLQPKATFWFGAVLSAIQEHQGKQLHDDSSSSQKIQLLHLMTTVLGSIAAFYQQERPIGVYRLLNFIGELLQQWSQCCQYLFVVAKVGYLNMLAIYHIKIKQYTYALEVFAHLFQLYNQKVVDCTNEIFLSILSNYLSLLGKTSKKTTSKRLEVEQGFTDLFFKLFTKIMLLEKQTTFQEHLNSLVVLSATYNQHDNLLMRFEKDLNSVITHCYQHLAKAKRKLPQNMVAFVMRDKVRRSIAFRISINLEELLFFSGNRLFSKTPAKQKITDSDEKLGKMEVMLSQTIEMLQDQKISSNRYALSQSLSKPKDRQDRYSTINSVGLPIETPQQTLDVSDRGQIRGSIRKSVHPLARSYTRKKDPIKPAPAKPMKQWGHSQKTMKFKIYSIFVDVYEDGVLLFDYTNQNKRYIEWNTLSLLMERLDGQFVFQEFLKVPVQCYFDFVRILSYYLTKNDRRQICLQPTPLPLLESNSLLRLYKQEGSFLKLALMNIYDTEKYVGVIDLFLIHFDQFFKQLTQNEYILFLNDRISAVGTKDPPERDIVFHLDFFKKKRQTTSAELGNLLPINIVQAVLNQKQSFYKCLCLLKNNFQILVQLIEPKGQQNESDFVTVKVEGLQRFNTDIYGQQEKKMSSINRLLQIPMVALTNYFPLYDKSIKEYFNNYSRMIMDCLCNFQDSGDQDIGGLSFNIIVHGSRSEMIEYGKYYSVVSAQLVGSKNRIWALLIRFYDLAFLRYNTVVMMNPYEGFLQNVINFSKQQQSQILKNMLIGQSVKETYLWLKSRGRLGCRFNIFEYLFANRLI